MEPLDVSTIRELRANLETNLPHSCNIQSDTGALVDGAHRFVWTDAAVSTPCMLSPVGGTEGMRQDQTSVKSTWQVRFPAETVVSERNRLVVSGRDPVSGLAFGRILIVTSIGGLGRHGEAARIVAARDALPSEL
jgi:hypothetical protein